jgi:hypothetical protein
MRHVKVLNPPKVSFVTLTEVVSSGTVDRVRPVTINVGVIKYYSQHDEAVSLVEILDKKSFFVRENKSHIDRLIMLAQK